MKHLLILTVGICLLISVPAMGGQSGDKAAVRQAYENLIAASVNRDFESYTALCIENFESWDGTIKGREAWGKMVADTYTRLKDRQVKQLEEIGIIFVTPDVAIHKQREEVTGNLDTDGKSLPPDKRLAARIFVKKNGQWLYAASFYRPIEE